MDTALGYFLAFLMTLCAFAFGWEFGCKQYRDLISPRRMIEPRFRVVWRNPRMPDRKLSK